MKRIFVFAALAALEAAAGSLYVECESFRDLGGWIVDPHSMRQIGSSYLSIFSNWSFLKNRSARRVEMRLREEMRGRRIGPRQAGGVPCWQNSRNPNLTQKICYDIVRREHTRTGQVKGK